jgi:hypothetical protein
MTTKSKTEKKLEIVEEEKDSIENSVRPIDILLNLNGEAINVQDSIHVKRLAIDWIVRALTQDEFEEIASRASKRIRRDNGVGYRNTVDNAMSNRLMIYYASVDPNFRDSKADALYAKYKVDKTRPDDLIKLILLPGEIIAISNMINQLSGFADMFEQFAEITENL